LDVCPHEAGMQPGRARAIALAAAMVGSGCAELAPSVPALTIEAVALQRRDVSAGERARWSWAVGARLAGGLDARVRAPEPEPAEPLALAAARGTRAPCRVPELCAWEARARTRALARLRRALPEEGER